jgi:hypothetical protein
MYMGSEILGTLLELGYSEHPIVAGENKREYAIFRGR